MQISIDGQQQEMSSAVEADGALIDVDDAVANGYHAGSRCTACGALLEEIDEAE